MELGGDQHESERRAAGNVYAAFGGCRPSCILLVMGANQYESSDSNALISPLQAQWDANLMDGSTRSAFTSATESMGQAHIRAEASGKQASTGVPAAAGATCKADDDSLTTAAFESSASPRPESELGKAFMHEVPLRGAAARQARSRGWLRART